MNKDLLQFLQCPRCGAALSLSARKESGGKVEEGTLTCAGGHMFPVLKGIPRFVETDAYVKSFSFEWKKHRLTQHDHASGYTISQHHFVSRFAFPAEDLRSKLVLDAGCGTGRFAEIALSYGARVIAVDLSYAVEVAHENLGKNHAIDVVQADIFALPFKKEVFDCVYSFGVLHHTPDAKKAFLSLPQFLKKGGAISIFVYSSYNKAIVYTSNFWRFFTTRLPKSVLYMFSFIAVPLYYVYKIPVIGTIGKMVFVIPMWRDWRWRVLDTFDWYSPRYQSKHTHWEVYGWFKEARIADIAIHPDEISLSGTKE
jgi:SAM-dependent methyltransferase